MYICIVAFGRAILATLESNLFPFRICNRRTSSIRISHRPRTVTPQLLAGLGRSRAEGLFLGPPEEFHMVSQGGCVTVSDEVDDALVSNNTRGGALSYDEATS